ncbi:hypothetical protein VUR80DRAFT_8259 [Thermomyces stellatus]
MRRALLRHSGDRLSSETSNGLRVMSRPANKNREFSRSWHPGYFTLRPRYSGEQYLSQPRHASTTQHKNTPVPSSRPESLAFPLLLPAPFPPTFPHMPRYSKQAKASATRRLPNLLRIRLASPKLATAVQAQGSYMSGKSQTCAWPRSFGPWSLP